MSARNPVARRNRDVAMKVHGAGVRKREPRRTLSTLQFLLCQAQTAKLPLVNEGPAILMGH